MNTYSPKFAANNLTWYKSDGLSTSYDQRKCEDFLRDTDAHFKDAKFINSDIIRKQCRGEVLPKDILVEYQTVRDNDGLKYPENEQTKNFIKCI